MWASVFNGTEYQQWRRRETLQLNGPCRSAGSDVLERSGRANDFPSVSYQTRSSAVREISGGSLRVHVLFKQESVRPRDRPVNKGSASLCLSPDHCNRRFSLLWRPRPDGSIRWIPPPNSRIRSRQRSLLVLTCSPQRVVVIAAVSSTKTNSRLWNSLWDVFPTTVCISERLLSTPMTSKHEEEEEEGKRSSQWWWIYHRYCWSVDERSQRWEWSETALRECSVLRWHRTVRCQCRDWRPFRSHSSVCCTDDWRASVMLERCDRPRESSLCLCWLLVRPLKDVLDRFRVWRGTSRIPRWRPWPWSRRIDRSDRNWTISPRHGCSHSFEWASSSWHEPWSSIHADTGWVYRSWSTDLWTSVERGSGHRWYPQVSEERDDQCVHCHFAGRLVRRSSASLYPVANLRETVKTRDLYRPLTLSMVFTITRSSRTMEFSFRTFVSIHRFSWVPNIQARDESSLPPDARRSLTRERMFPIGEHHPVTLDPGLPIDRLHSLLNSKNLSFSLSSRLCTY